MFNMVLCRWRLAGFAVVVVDADDVSGAPVMDAVGFSYVEAFSVSWRGANRIVFLIVGGYIGGAFRLLCFFEACCGAHMIPRNLSKVCFCAGG